jgi:hypothetical protein
MGICFFKEVLRFQLNISASLLGRVARSLLFPGIAFHFLLITTSAGSSINSVAQTMISNVPSVAKPGKILNPSTGLQLLTLSILLYFSFINPKKSFL